MVFSNARDIFCRLQIVFKILFCNKNFKLKNKSSKVVLKVIKNNYVKNMLFF